MRVVPEIVLTSDEQADLARVVKSNSSSPRLTQRARIVLLAARGMQNKEIATELNVGRVQVARWRERYIQLGLAGIERDLPRGAPATSVDVQKLIRLTAKARPDAATPWSTRTMAAALGISPASVSRHWRAHGLAPRAGQGSDLPLDARVATGLEDVVGLFVARGALVLALSCGEMEQAQAANDAALGRKVRTTAPPRASLAPDTAKLLAVLDTLDEKANGMVPEHPSYLERLRFLRRIDRETPKDKTLHLITRQHAAYRQAAIKKWLATHTRFKLHFIPASSRWVHTVERFFNEASDKGSRHAFASVPKLVAVIEAQVARPDLQKGAFIWTTHAREIRQKASADKAGLSSNYLATPKGQRKESGVRGSASALAPGHSLREHVTNLKREQILQKAAQLFFEHGYLQTSVDSIAQRLGATKPFVYYHFQSKADILIEICERSNRDALAAAEAAMSADGSPRERLEQFLREFTNIALQQHQLVAIYFREALSLPHEAGDRINKMRKSINLKLNALLSEGINSGDFQIEDPRMAALVIAGMSSYAFAWYREEGRLDQAEVTNRIVKMALKLVSATPQYRPAYRVHSVPTA